MTVSRFFTNKKTISQNISHVAIPYKINTHMYIIIYINWLYTWQCSICYILTYIACDMIPIVEWCQLRRDYHVIIFNYIIDTAMVWILLHYYSVVLAYIYIYIFAYIIMIFGTAAAVCSQNKIASRQHNRFGVMGQWLKPSVKYSGSTKVPSHC